MEYKQEYFGFPDSAHKAPSDVECYPGPGGSCAEVSQLSYLQAKRPRVQDENRTIHTPSPHPLVNFIVVGINDQPANILNFYSLAKSNNILAIKKFKQTMILLLGIA